MADHASPVGPNFLTTQTADPGLTAKLWRGIDRSRGATDPLTGFFHVERGQGGIGAYTSTQATTGTAIYIPSPTTGMGAVLELDSNSTTNTQGIQVQYTGLGVTPKDGMLICWETMLQAKDIATAPEFFAGMSVLDRNETTIIASGAMSASDWIGFYDVTDGTLSFGVEDGSQDISANTAHTLVDADVTTDGSAWVRLGFRWEVGTKLEAYVNGATVDISDVAESNAPDTAIACSYVCQSNGTTDPIVLVAYTAFGYSQIR